MSGLIVEASELRRGQLPLNKIVRGDALEVLKKFPSESVDCVVTSPPYFAKRMYPGTEKVWGGSEFCKHEFDGDFCKKCGAWRGSLGLEPTPEMFVDHLIAIFREVKRVLKPHGNCFVVIDDAYSGSGWGPRNDDPMHSARTGKIYADMFDVRAPPKSLILVPELFAMRMVYDLSFILRQKLIWTKKVHLYKDRTTIGNAMPESVSDRLCHTWEYVFHFVKEPKYYYDLDIVRIPHKTDAVNKLRDKSKEPYNQSYPGGAFSPGARPQGHPLGANPGDVLQINTEPLKESHYAPFPTQLVEFLLKVGCPEWVCKRCGKPRERIVEVGEFVKTGGSRKKDTPSVSEWQKKHGTGYHLRYTVGWTDCGCNASWRPGVVLDPFLGSGTTALVALRLNRWFVGIELSPEYTKMAAHRIEPYVKQKRLWEFEG